MSQPIAGAGAVACQSCVDAGYFMEDGKPYACHCPAGVAWAKRRYDGKPGSWASPSELPPGGEVMARQAAREAAHIPVGAMEDHRPIRAMLVDDQTMHESLTHIVRLCSTLEESAPARLAAITFLKGLPEQYRATLPPMLTPKPPRQARKSAAPTAPPGTV